MIIDYNGVQMHSTQTKLFAVHTLDFVSNNSALVNLLSISSAPACTRVDLWSNKLTDSNDAWYVIYAANPEYGNNIFNLFNVRLTFTEKLIRVPVSGIVDLTMPITQANDVSVMDLKKLPSLNYNFIT